MTKNPTSTSSNPSIRLPRKILEAWKASIPKFCKTKGRKKIQELKDLHGYASFSAAEIRGLWEVFNTDRAKVPSYLKNANKQCAAYLLGFHLPNVARSLLLFQRATEIRSQLKDFDHIQLIDMGCGTGALSSAFLHFFSRELNDKNVELHLVDKQRRMVECAKEITHFVNSNVEARTWTIPFHDFQKKFRTPKEKALVVIMAGNFLNELSQSGKFIDWLRRLNSDDNINLGLMLVEPAQQAHARAAMTMVQNFSSIDLQTIYPCQGALTCPMLSRARDWCFSDQDMVVPREVSLINRITGVDHKKISAAAFWIQSTHLDIKSKSRIVGLPVSNKMGQKTREYLLCDGEKISKKPCKPEKRGYRGEFL